MKKDTKKVIRFTSITEYKTLEKYLEMMAAKGLMLCEIKRNTLIFTKTIPRELTFDVSLFYHTTPFDYPDDEKDKDYRELCEESGWEFCTSNEIYQIFYKEKNAEAIPIHTDSQEEYRIIKNIFMKTEFISMIAIFLMVSTGLIQTFNFSYENLLSNGALFSVISPFFLITIVLFLFSPSVIWLIKNNINLSNGKELSFSTNKARVMRNIITWSLLGIYFIVTIFAVSDGFTNGLIVIFAFMPIFISIFVAMYCVKRFKTKKCSRKHNIVIFSVIIFFTVAINLVLVMRLMFSVFEFAESNDIPQSAACLELSDFCINAKPERSRIFEKSSIFVPASFDYYESLGRKAKDNKIRSVSTEYIQCVNKDIADYIFNGYMAKEQNRHEKWIEEYLEFGCVQDAKKEENQISKVSQDLWNIDRGYYLRESKSEIIIQKDNIIYILEGDVDFSEKEIVDICEGKLGL